jgi:hypothetical protein
MLKRITAKVGAAASIAATAGALMLGVSAPASATETGANGEMGTSAVCGYYESGLRGFYNHCGPTNITIHVTYTVGSDEDYCVTPGITGLGYWSSNAWYTGLC